MSETAAYMALVETASLEGVQARQQYLRKYGPQEMGWNYANILEVAPVLKRQLDRRGFFRVYLFVSNGGSSGVRYCMDVIDLKTYPEPAIFDDPADGRSYLVYSRMKVRAIHELERPITLDEFKSVDRRKPDLRHLQLGFLFVVDPEA